MARPIVVTRDGKPSSFAFAKLDRNKLYRHRRRVVLDGQGNPCSRAELTDDGELLIRLGMTAQGYFTDDGRWVSSRDLQAMTPEGEVLEEKLPSSLGDERELHGPVDPSELLDLQMKAVYALDPEEVEDALLTSLDAGDIYRFSFNYTASYDPDTAYLLANEHGAFAVVGRPTTPEWCALDAIVPDSFEDEGEDDDLDFDFF